jgi:VWFA-related protein
MTPIVRTAAAAFLLLVRAPAAQESQAGDVPRFRVSVDAVRIDAVVTDGNGRIVRDLTADEFEVLQNGRRQKVTFAQFVPVAANPGADQEAVARSDARVRPESSPVVSPVTRSSIQRTLAIVIDDLGLSVESLISAKRALHTFIDRDLLPTDLAGILRTGGSASSVYPFTTDRRVLHDAVDALRWNGFSRSGVEAFDAINQWTTFDDRTGLSDVNDFKALDQFRRSTTAAGTLGALNLAIQGARDLPGRKALLFVSEGFQMFDADDTRVREALDRAVDQAARAGVVIYSLDARGLQSGGLQAADNLKRPTSGQTMEQTVREKAADRGGFNRDTQEGLAYLAEQTGGFAVLNTNDLARGLGRISADVRDYYVIGYLPEAGTFVGPGKKPSYQKISVKVRRPGVRVRTRKEFLGVSDSEDQVSPPTPAQTLVRAAISPFTSSDIALQITALPGYVRDAGLFVRTLLHIDARALTFADGDSGRKSASADVLGMVFDRDGTEVAHLSTGFEVALTDGRMTDEALREGLAYMLRVPIPAAGAYQLRFAVRDRASGRLGNAGEFVQIPDIRRGVFALSGIVLRSADADASGDGPAAEITAISPSQALATFRAGAELSYSYEIYNAAKQVRPTTTIWRGTQSVATLPGRTLAVPAGREGRFAVSGRLKLGESLPPGTYALHVSAVTAPADGKAIRTAVQRVSFELR